MANRTRTTLEQIAGAGIFDLFEPMRKFDLMQHQADRILGYDSIRKLDSIVNRADIASSLTSIVEPKVLEMFQDSTVRQLGLGIQRPLLEDTIKKLGVGTSLIDSFNKADLYGVVRLDDMLGQIKGLSESVLIGSTVLPPDYLQSMGLTAKIQPRLDQLFASAHFEPGRMLEQFEGLDTKALMLGRAGTLAAVRAPEIEWGPHRFFTASDLVAPVVADDELVTAAFPPDLVEEDPLSTEFEVDAIVAEDQIGAQIFLALRTPKAADRMNSARQRLREGDAEALAQCLTSCRRALHALADVVYPARRGKVTDRAGIEREVHAEAFKNRLLMFLAEALEGSTMQALAEAMLDKAVGHLDALVDQLNKGVHADVLRDEAAEAYVETWRVIARVGRIYSDD